MRDIWVIVEEGESKTPRIMKLFYKENDMKAHIALILTITYFLLASISSALTFEELERGAKATVDENKQPGFVSDIELYYGWIFTDSVEKFMRWVVMVPIIEERDPEEMGKQKRGKG
jgi:hypothetical protein